jgi:hypothetical protein|tara:strand:- start:329 stop:478 length:150 start_codon:yes stop_codon:yes gene_type:complete
MKKVNELKISESCRYCEDTGIRQISNGEDDYDEEYCDCPSGEKLTNEEI